MKFAALATIAVIALCASWSPVRAEEPAPDLTILAIAPLGMSESDLGRPYSETFEPLIGKEGRSVFPGAKPPRKVIVSAWKHQFLSFESTVALRANARALTIIHGDAHTWNFLFPRTADGAAFLIDWQLWHLDLGARDLAFMMALHWYPGRRREVEKPLLKYYHDGLMARGIGNYTLGDLMLDYRRCVVRNLTIPILFWNRGMKPEGWWARLECALAAYRDLGCEEVL